MPLSMKGYGKKNPQGYVNRKTEGSRNIENNVTTITYTFLDIDKGKSPGDYSEEDQTSVDGISNEINSPGNSSSGVQMYSMNFALEKETGGIREARIKRVADTPQNGSTYLTYEVTLFRDPDSNQKSITLGAPKPAASDSANFYFSSLGINEGIAIAGSGNIVGTLYRDSLNGSNRDDTLDGAGGADYLRGGNGNDTYIVYDVDTRIEETPQTGIETVISYVDWTLGEKTGVDHLTLRGAALNGTGNELNNTIKGNANNNTLIGGLGNDTLVGNEGNDVLNGFGIVASTAAQIDHLSGGAGADYFVLGGAWGVSYVEPGDGYAVIKDWTTADAIQVRNIGSYSLETKSVGGIGNSAKDTEIYFTDASGNRDRIAVIADSTNVRINRDFVFV